MIGCASFTLAIFAGMLFELKGEYRSLEDLKLIGLISLIYGVPVGVFVHLTVQMLAWVFGRIRRRDDNSITGSSRMS